MSGESFGQAKIGGDGGISASARFAEAKAFRGYVSSDPHADTQEALRIETPTVADDDDIGSTPTEIINVDEADTLDNTPERVMAQGGAQGGKDVMVDINLKSGMGGQNNRTEVRDARERRVFPKVLGGREFEFEDRLGQGGMGTVYRAREIKPVFSIGKHYGSEKKYFEYEPAETEYGPDVVIKVLRKDLLVDEDAEKQFIREMQAMAELGNNLNAVKLLDFVETDQGPGIVMEYIPDGDLRNFIYEQGHENIDDAFVGDIASEICLFLDEAHRKGFIHRDLKLANIFVIKQPNLHIRIGDFGIMKAIEDAQEYTKKDKDEEKKDESTEDEEKKDESTEDEDEKDESTEKIATVSDYSNLTLRNLALSDSELTRPDLITQAGDIKGTLRYLSPELFLFAPASYSTDLYALGTMMYEVLSRKTPYAESERKLQSKEISILEYMKERLVSKAKPIHEVIGMSEPSVLHKIIMTLIEVEPEDRKEVELNGEKVSLATAADIAKAIDTYVIDRLGRMEQKTRFRSDESSTVKGSDLLKTSHLTYPEGRDTVSSSQQEYVPVETPTIQEKIKKTAK